MSKSPRPKPYPMLDKEGGYHWKPEVELNDIKTSSNFNWVAAIVLGLILLLALAGCSRHTAAPPSVSHHDQQDSIRETVVVRIDTIKVMVPVEIPVERIVNVLPDTDTSTLETSVAVSTAFIDSLGLLHHTLDNKAQTIEKPVDVTVPVSETTHEEFHSKVDSDTVYVEVPAQLSKGQKFLINMGWGAIVVIIGLLLFLGWKLWRGKSK